MKLVASAEAKAAEDSNDPTTGSLADGPQRHLGPDRR
jgi:hypothetical protein